MSATISGSIIGSSGLPYPAAKVMFSPLTTPLPVVEGLAVSAEQTLTTNNVGYFSLTLVPGEYRVVVNDKDSCTIVVPDSGSYDIADLIILGVNFSIPSYLNTTMVGDSGSGGVAGLVPAPPAGSAASDKYLSAYGDWRTPPGGGSGASNLASMSDVLLASLITGQALVYNGANGKWQNSTIAPGNGAKWYAAGGVPSNAQGVNGDFYLNLANGDVYQKISNAWANIGNIRGATGATGAAGGSNWHSGSGTPSGGLGVNGDYYLHTVSGDVFHKVSGSWGSAIVNLKGVTGNTGATGATGPSGLRGTQWYLTTAVPGTIAGSAENDLALNITTGNVYRRSAGTSSYTWTSLGSLRGPAGSGSGSGTLALKLVDPIYLGGIFIPSNMPASPVHNDIVITLDATKRLWKYDDTTIDGWVLLGDFKGGAPRLQLSAANPYLDNIAANHQDTALDLATLALYRYEKDTVPGVVSSYSGWNNPNPLIYGPTGAVKVLADSSPLRNGVDCLGTSDAYVVNNPNDRAFLSEAKLGTSDNPEFTIQMEFLCPTIGSPGGTDRGLFAFTPSAILPTAVFSTARAFVCAISGYSLIVHISGASSPSTNYTRWTFPVFVPRFGGTRVSLFLTYNKTTGALSMTINNALAHTFTSSTVSGSGSGNPDISFTGRMIAFPLSSGATMTRFPVYSFAIHNDLSDVVKIGDFMVSSQVPEIYRTPHIALGNVGNGDLALTALWSFTGGATYSGSNTFGNFRSIQFTTTFDAAQLVVPIASRRLYEVRFVVRRTSGSGFLQVWAGGSFVTAAAPTVNNEWQSVRLIVSSATGTTFSFVNMSVTSCEVAKVELRSISTLLDLDFAGGSGRCVHDLSPCGLTHYLGDGAKYMHRNRSATYQETIVGSGSPNRFLGVLTPIIFPAGVFLKRIVVVGDAAASFSLGTSAANPANVVASVALAEGRNVLTIIKPMIESPSLYVTTSLPSGSVRIIISYTDLD